MKVPGPCLAALVAAAAGCAAPDSGGDAWEARVLWEGAEKVQSVTVGDVDPLCPGLEAVAADAAGRTILVSFEGGVPRAEVPYEHGAKLTSLLVADLDPLVPGNELYVGGFRAGESGGAVVQLVVRGGRAKARTVWEGGAFVHALARLAPERGSAGGELVVTTYDGEVQLATRGRTQGPWASRLLHCEPPTADPEEREIKDCVAGPIGGDPRGRIFLATVSGRGVLLDPRGGRAAEVIHHEEGGIARVALDASGDLYLAGNAGRVVRLSRAGGVWRAAPLYRDLEALRGIAVSAFWVGGGRAPLAVFGYSGRCRALLPRGSGWDSFTLFEDTDKGHWLAAGDLVPGNGSDELVLGGYSGRVVLLSVRPGKETPR